MLRGMRETRCCMKGTFLGNWCRRKEGLPLRTSRGNRRIPWKIAEVRPFPTYPFIVATTIWQFWRNMLCQKKNGSVFKPQEFNFGVKSPPSKIWGQIGFCDEWCVQIRCLPFANNHCTLYSVHCTVQVEFPRILRPTRISPGFARILARKKKTNVYGIFIVASELPAFCLKKRVGLHRVTLYGQ